MSFGMFFVVSQLYVKYYHVLKGLYDSVGYGVKQCYLHMLDINDTIMLLMVSVLGHLRPCILYSRH